MHYNGDKSYVLGNDKEIINFEAKDSKTMPYTLCLGNISKDFDLVCMEKTELTGYVHNFSVDYLAIENDKILDIHKYLVGKIYNIKCLEY